MLIMLEIKEISLKTNFIRIEKNPIICLDGWDWMYLMKSLWQLQACSKSITAFYELTYKCRSSIVLPQIFRNTGWKDFLSSPAELGPDNLVNNGGPNGRLGDLEGCKRI